MKGIQLIAVVYAMVISTPWVNGQGFINLGFESAKIIPVSTNGDGSVNVATTNALPGWTAWYITHQLTVIPYNATGASLLPFVGLFGSDAAILSGNFDVYLKQGSSISQTGLIPTNAASLLFDVRAPYSTPLAVSLGGQNLSYIAISNALNSSGYSYTIYGANISALAGQIATLTFLEDNDYAILDDIRFSDQPIPVPEPGGLGWLAFGSGVLLYVIRRRHH